MSDDTAWNYLGIGSAIGIAVAIGAIAQQANPPAVLWILAFVFVASLIAPRVMEFIEWLSQWPLGDPSNDYAETAERQRARRNAG